MVEKKDGSSDKIDSVEPNNSNSSITNTATKENDFDLIPQSVYDNLPALLKDACNIFDKYERDVFFYGALSVLGGCFNNLYAFNDVDKRKVATNLLTFIVAPSANGKGVLNFAKKIAANIKTTFAANSKKLGSNNTNKLIIPVNISSAGLVELLQQNEGIGIMIESEIDTLINANKQDWGNYSDILRNSFENESASLYRKSDKQHAEIENLKLSFAISGTPNQFKNLIVSAENGLFSRGCYYVFENTNPLLECYGRFDSPIDLDEQFAKFAKTANDYYELHLTLDSIQVVFSEHQLSSIQDVLQSEYNRIAKISELRSNLNRSFVVALKVATQITFLQECEKGTLTKTINCSDNALRIAIDFMLTSLRHSYKAYELLPKKSKASLTVNQERLYFELPNEFTRAEAVSKAAEIKVSTKTIDNYLKVYKEKDLVEVLAHGSFRKTA